MIIDLSDANCFLGEGTHFVKVVKIEEDFTKNNDPALKITFQDRTNCIFIDFFPLIPSMKWKIAELAKAVGVYNPQTKKVDTNDLINKFLYIEIDSYTAKDGKSYQRIKKFKASKLSQNEMKEKVENPFEKNKADFNTQPVNIKNDFDDGIPF